MAKRISFPGQWKGFFIYGPEYGLLEGEKVTFMLFLESNEKGFWGKAFDIDGVGTIEGVATIKGFYQNGEISFIKQYPKNYEVDEKGLTTLVDDKPSPEIHYYGEYNESLQIFGGKWEMVIYEVRDGEGFIEYMCTGTWEMRKEE